MVESVHRMPKTPRELRAAVEAGLWDATLEGVPLTDGDFEAMAAGPIYEDIAEVFEKLSRGRIKRSDWPRVIPSLHRKSVLHKRSQRSTMESDKMNADQRINISRGQDNTDPWLRAVRKAGFTQNDLAKKLGIPPSLLSMYRKALRPIPVERAKKVTDLIGWPATAKNWPGGILEE